LSFILDKAQLTISLLTLNEKNMLKPNFKLTTIKSDGNSAEIYIEPLEKGLGHTLGNSLRRVLLTNLEGAAATSIAIDGVNHQFSTLSGLAEDIVQFVLGFKGVAFKLETEGPETVSIEVKGKKTITAADIVCPTGVSIANPDHVLGTLTSDKARLKATLTIERGVGYMPAEEHGTPEIGLIPLDSVFTPVVRANYSVEATRVGRRTDLDRIRLEVETNGTITPQEAVEKASRLLAAYFTQAFEPKFDKDITAPEVRVGVDLSVDEFDLPVRVVNALKKGGYKKLSDLAGINKGDLMKIKNLGEKSVGEIINQLATRGVEVK